ncbi:chloride channel protein, CIC family [Abditibacterium utsteinense]|uniref:Chloride channel protein, CIC family n=1 Tax=Abditibacterium utsteinense TaxID=1960156 RepID=A0A2S8SXA0_9BACT|nr:H(+)/Cl(-) exchange transporter ClcA [Abditibacterium utsteinense]PQV65430.1 chloride channel protein, CIC family [Abditibacterium utsteinense]
MNIEPEIESEIGAAHVAELEHARSEAQRRRLWPRAALVGAAAGVLAVAFRGAASEGDILRAFLITFAHRFGILGCLIPAFFGAFCAGVGAFLVQKFAPETSGSGIPHLQAVLHGWKTLVPRRVLPVKFVGGALAMASGLAIGREGPTLQMSGAMADLIASRTRATGIERRSLLAAGAGAGLAAAFNAPLAGMLFVLEEMQRDFSPSVFTAGFLACIVGNAVTHVFNGTASAFQIPIAVAPDVKALPLFALSGAVAGVFGVVFNRGLIKTLDLTLPLSHWPRGLLAALVGFGVGALAFFAPDWVGSGHGLAESALDGKLLFGAIPLLFVVRLILTQGSYATGVAGGIFAPLLCLGSILGLGCGLVCHALFPGLDARVFAVVGMAAYFASVVRAPLTGIVLIAEMTGDYALLLPLFVASFAAYGVAEAMREMPIYETLLERSLLPGERALGGN